MIFADGPATAAAAAAAVAEHGGSSGLLASAEESLRRRLVHPLHPLPLPHPAPPPPPPSLSQEPDSEPESSCSDSGPSTAFRPTAASPHEDSPTAPGPSGQQQGNSDYPSPNISVGPPIHPPPHLLPYLYPHGLYPGASGGHPLLGPGHPLSLFGAAAHHNPGLLAFNTLALAQHPFFNHAAYSASVHSHPHSHSLKAAALASGAHRFAPYPLPVTPHSLVGGSPLGSAFETVTPGTTSPALGPSTVTSPPASPLRSPSTTASSPAPDTTSTASELKSIEKMVNGLEMKTSHPDLLNHHVKCEEASK